MVAALLIGSLALVVNMSILVMALVVVIGIFVRRVDSGSVRPGFLTDVMALGILLLMLYLGHLLQFATWGALFVWLGEFQDFETALYHSTVNFTSLGYGDIVMSPKWRMLGALEAANGVLMFGLSAGAILSVMNRMFSHHKKRLEARLQQ